MFSEELLRVKIATTKSGVARGVLKVVLGEFQQKNASGKATEQDGFNIIEKIVNGNRETLGLLKADDPRRSVLEEEIAVVSEMLPTYLNADDLASKLTGETQLLADVKSAKGDGQATGLIVKWAKSQKLDVKGDTVKEVVQKIRSA